MVAHGLVFRLNGDRHRIGGLIAHDGSAQQLVDRDPIALGQGDQEAENRAAQVDDAGICPIVKIQRVAVQSVQEHRFLQNQVLPGPDRFERARLRLGKGEVLLQLAPLEYSPGAGHGQIVLQAPSRPCHDGLRNLQLSDSVDGFQKFS